MSDAGPVTAHGSGDARSLIQAPQRPDTERVERPPDPPGGVTHVNGFDRGKTLCGKAVTGNSRSWINSRAANLVGCVVCAELLAAMTAAEKKALNIFWGGDGKRRPGAAA